MSQLSRQFIVVMIVLTLIITACSSGATPTPTPAAPAAAPTTAPTSAPVPTATPAPTATTAPTDTPAPQAASGDACLIGTWEMTDMSDYFTSIMAKTNTPFKLADKKGSVRITFGADGKAAMAADQWQVTLSGTVQGVVLKVVVSINGAATADYTAADGKIVFSNRRSDNMIMSSTVNGQELFSGTSDELASLFGVSGSNNAYNTFPFECGSDTLKYTPPIKNASPVILTRVNP